jgi:hypothetical protein
LSAGSGRTSGIVHACSLAWGCWRSGEAGSTINAMLDVQVIIDEIDQRLIEVREQIAALEAARRALTGMQPSRRRPAVTRPAVDPRPAKARRSPTTSSAPAPAPAPAAGRTKSKEVPSPAATSPAARAAKSPRRNRSRELEPGQVEDLLRDSEDGLSVVALARRTGVSETNVRERLQGLQRSGQVRSSGSRRTSLWRLVSDEERIAERAAELARASER